MLRAGMIRQVARGIYDFLPLVLRVVRMVEQIVRMIFPCSVMSSS